LQLGIERSRIDYDTVADHAGTLVVENTGRDKSQDKLSVADANGVTGIVAALISSDQVKMRRKDVDYLALAFIAPLGSHYDNVFHLNLSARVMSERAAGAGLTFGEAQVGNDHAPEQNYRRTPLTEMCAPAI